MLTKIDQAFMDHNSKESALVVGSSLVDWEILGDRYDLIDKERL